MTLAEDKWPEASRLVELRPYSLQLHPCCNNEVDVLLSTLMEYQLVAE
jgi:hypothetical protein